MIKNIMSVDLEDYYCDLPFSEWHKYESRIVHLTRNILDLLEEYNVCVTFFTVGYIAERHPELIEEIKSQGHEIASHGYSHTNIFKIGGVENFEVDLVKSLKILERASGERVLGFRAPYFSINKKNLWALKVIKRHLAYDSSIFPVGPHYGLSDAPRHLYRMSDKNPLYEDDYSKFLELPMATLKIGRMNIPVAGGVYLRFLPYWMLGLAIRKFNNKGLPTTLYIHPKDFDLDTPRIPGYKWHDYWGLKYSKEKVRYLLREFSFSSANRVLDI